MEATRKNITVALAVVNEFIQIHFQSPSRQPEALPVHID